MIEYWSKKLPLELAHLKNSSYTKKLVMASFLAIITTLFQSSPVFLPLIGYVFSALSTIPFFLTASLGIQFLLLTYIETLLLLYILVPSEMVIFASTTGLLGVGFGLLIPFSKKRWHVVFSGGLFLCIGILLVLILLDIPILGPITFNGKGLQIGFIFVGSVLYAWIYLEIILVIIHKLGR